MSLSALYVRARTYVYMALMTLIALSCLVQLIIFLPVRLVSVRLYRMLTGQTLALAVPGFLLAPSLAGARRVEIGGAGSPSRSSPLPLLPRAPRHARARPRGVCSLRCARRLALSRPVARALPLHPQACRCA